MGGGVHAATPGHHCWRLDRAAHARIEVHVVVAELFVVNVQAASNADDAVHGIEHAGLDDDIIRIEVKGDTENVLQRGSGRGQ